MTNALRDILYVDDELANRHVFEAAFEDDFRIHLASSAREALSILESRAIPVVVADQRMPEMTGVEMFELLRERYPQIQRIVLSGYTDTNALIDAVNKGQVFQFVQKPWDQLELLSVLRRAVDTHDLLLQNSVLTERLMLAQQVASLGQAAAEIAHEMGNQLNLLPLVETIEDEYSEDPQLCELASLARHTHDRLSRLIDEIKTFVRQGTQPNTNAGIRQQVDLVSCVRELLSFLRFHRRIPLHVLSVRLPAQRALVLGDHFKLQQVFVNLLLNAADAIRDLPDGHIELKLDELPAAYRVTVTDNGCGIPPEDLPRIWELFYSTKGSSGTGIGLDVVKNVVAQHRGEITCQSTIGQGTTFIITLPSLEMALHSELSNSSLHLQ
jgi:signal transduction histidine kinase